MLKNIIEDDDSDNNEEELQPEKIEMYVEEEFGILTDDQLYLDCLLVKPRETEDDGLKALRIWVPKFPLTKSSLLSCARQDVKAYGSKGPIGHLLFDLRGTGHSERKDLNFKIDLVSIKAWARERFGKIKLQFMGFPERSGEGKVLQFPVRSGVFFENYEYKSARPEIADKRPTLLYFSTYGQFSPKDDQICATLAKAGYHVYGLDPLRYLLHAAFSKRVKLKDLFHDMSLFCRSLPTRPIIIGQPIGAGLALMSAVGVEEVQGVIAIGEAQDAFRNAHIFNNKNPHTYFLNRHVYRIAPRPMVLVRMPKDPMGGPEDQLNSMLEIALDPKRYDIVEKVTSKYLYSLVQWIEKNINTEE